MDAEHLLLAIDERKRKTIAYRQNLWRHGQVSKIVRVTENFGQWSWSARVLPVITKLQQSEKGRTLARILVVRLFL